MRRPIAAWLAFTATALCLAAAAFLPDEDWPLGAILFLGTALMFSALCGGLVASRRPDNVVGWLLVGIAFCISSGLLATQWANRALVDQPGSVPGGLTAAWFQSWLWTPLTGLFPLLVLLFPTGSLASRRWRPVAWVSVAAAVLPTVGIAMRPGPFDTFPNVTNPLGVAVIPREFFGVWAGAWLLTIPAALVSLFVRFRRARDLERQQIKWFFLAAISGVVLVLTNPLIFLVLRRDPVVFGVSIGLIFPVLAFAMLPASIALAVLRYRLYDIDRIISRTFSYAIITVFLGGTFALLVLLPPLVIGRGGTDVPDYMIAIATLVVAALFRPVRRRVQDVIDHRFNRRRYDAQHTVEAFAARLREQIDLDSLGTELRTVVSSTMHPSHVSLWVRPPAERR